MKFTSFSSLFNAHCIFTGVTKFFTVLVFFLKLCFPVVFQENLWFWRVPFCTSNSFRQARFSRCSFWKHGFGRGILTALVIDREFLFFELLESVIVNAFSFCSDFFSEYLFCLQLLLLCSKFILSNRFLVKPQVVFFSPENSGILWLLFWMQLLFCYAIFFVSEIVFCAIVALSCISIHWKCVALCWCGVILPFIKNSWIECSGFFSPEFQI